jgi:hypothetical protein
MSSTELKHWNPRVAPSKIRRLYELDARGIVDEEFIDDVGYAVFVRCEDIVEVTAARNGDVTCQKCGRIVRRVGGVDEVIVCPLCGWRVRWGDYQRTYNRKGLLAGIKGAPTINIFYKFVDDWTKCRSPQKKTLAIDQLIHSFHVDAKLNDTRPAACNVIKGNAHDVISLIDELAYGDQSTASIEETRDDWRNRLRATRFER